MKFGKSFASEMVQEWQEAYMDYNNLKAILKDMLKSREQNTSSSAPKGSLKRRVSLYKAFSGLIIRHRGSPLTRAMNINDDEDDEVVILVREEEREEGTNSSEVFYQSMFLKSSEEGGEQELVFFKKLDNEFNKVNGFYRKKVNEVMEEADDFSKQMNALIALRAKVDKVAMVGFKSSATTNIDSSFASANSMDHHINDARPRGSSLKMDVIQEIEMSNEKNSKDGSGSSVKQPNNSTAAAAASFQGFRPASLEILDHVKINLTTPETPVSTLRGLLLASNHDLSFSKKELQKVEEQMSIVLKEFYHKLQLLKRYSFLNLMAFSKIMKKYDKVTARNASKEYLKVVDNSYFCNTDEVNRLMEKVASAFIKHFANGNRRKGMETLRPTSKREKHRVTFLLGLLTGCSLALIVTLLVLIHARKLLNTNSAGRFRYMENIFPLYSFFGFIIVHMLMYSANIYFWNRFRINYPFIFGFKQGTELGYREVLLLSSGFAVLAMAAVLSNLDMEMDPRTRSFSELTELVPLGLLVVLLLITFCPFNIIYKSSRFFLIQTAFHCICAPLYKVNLPDHFFADQLTSQVQAFRSLEFFVCYYGWGNFKMRSNTCFQSDVYKIFYFIVAIIPFWIRSAQCLRRLIEERDVLHGLNGLKHISTMVALAMRTSNELNRGKIWIILAATSSGVAMVINTYWDIVMDWGLLRRNSKNPWLRDKLSVPRKSVYFVAMMLNVLLRLVWMQSVLGIRQTPFLHRTALTAIVACLEILRRGIWNFFRLENEHLNNVGKYRAFKSVPLPFKYDDDDEERRAR